MNSTQLRLWDLTRSASSPELEFRPTPAALPESPPDSPSSAPGSRARILALRARERALAAREAGCSGNSSELSRMSALLGYCLKMCLLSELPELLSTRMASPPLNWSFTGWKERVIACCHQPWLVLTMPGRHTGGSESGSSPGGSMPSCESGAPENWTTPMATDTWRSTQFAQGGTALSAQVAWGTPRASAMRGRPTPQAQDSEHSRGNAENRQAQGRQMQLTHAVAVAPTWPTPAPTESEMRTYTRTPSQEKSEHGRYLQVEALRETGVALEGATPLATDHKSGSVSPETLERNSRPLNEQVASLDGQQDPEKSNARGKPRAQLNSAWVAQLMGLPADWSEIASVTDATP